MATNAIELAWVRDGVFPGAAKEMRPSVAVAYQAAFKLLVDIISEVDDDNWRTEAWKSELLPKLHNYLTNNERVKISQSEYGKIVGSALVRILEHKPPDFVALWSTECDYFVGLIFEGADTLDSDALFKGVSQRWMILMVSILETLSFEDVCTENDSAVHTFLQMTARPVEQVISRTVASEGNWVDGMSFLALLADVSQFSSILSKRTEMQNLLDACKALFTAATASKLLNSPSVLPFIQFTAALSNVPGVNVTEAWDTTLEKAIPSDGPIAIQNQDSLLNQLILIAKPSWRHQFHAPSGVNTNLVSEFTTAANKAGDLGSTEVRQFIDTLVSLICLRGLLLVWI